MGRRFGVTDGEDSADGLGRGGMTSGVKLGGVLGRARTLPLNLT